MNERMNWKREKERRRKDKRITRRGKTDDNRSVFGDGKDLNLKVADGRMDKREGESRRM